MFMTKSAVDFYQSQWVRCPIYPQSDESGVEERTSRAVGAVGAVRARTNGTHRDVMKGPLEVLAGVGDSIDGAACLRALLPLDESTDEDDPLTLLARDSCPVVGIGGVG